MANSAPGVNINVSANAGNPATNNSTGTWFAVGMAAGPAGVAVPLSSLSDFNKYFSAIPSGQTTPTGRYTLNANVDSTLLYDALDVYFREGGVQAFVSRIQPTSTGVVATTGTTGGKFTLTAQGKGTWANSSSSAANGVILTLTNNAASGTNSIYATINYNGVTTASIGGLVSDTDVINWVNSLPTYQSMCTAAATAGTSALPGSSTTVSIYLTGGTDIAVSNDTDVVGALAVFTDLYGPGQVSFPGATTTTTYNLIANHAYAFNRVAVLDCANTSTVATLTGEVAGLQATATDPSYASFFAPWLVVPAAAFGNANTAAGFPANRVVAPCALAAAKMAANDVGNDSNNPAAGINSGASKYAVNITQNFAAADRATLNTAGVNVIRNVPNVNVIAIYGFRSAALDPNWVYLNNCRFRMQMVRDFDNVAENFVFAEIDGKGQIFSKLNGSLAGLCQSYWTRKSIYGITADAAFTINTGPLVNTPTTIAAGQINAQVSVKLSPFGEFVTINITKFAVNANIPY